jgi:hypothetical protein
VPSTTRKAWSAWCSMPRPGSVAGACCSNISTRPPPFTAGAVVAVTTASSRQRWRRTERWCRTTLAAHLPADSILIIDTVETIAALDAWLRESFLPRLPARTLVVLAGVAAMVLVVFFVVHAAQRFFVFSEASYWNLWVNRYWLLPHFIGGAIALLAGGAQFWAACGNAIPRPIAGPVVSISPACRSVRRRPTACRFVRCWVGLSAPPRS